MTARARTRKKARPRKSQTKAERKRKLETLTTPNPAQEPARIAREICGIRKRQDMRPLSREPDTVARRRLAMWLVLHHPDSGKRKTGGFTTRQIASAMGVSEGLPSWVSRDMGDTAQISGNGKLAWMLDNYIRACLSGREVQPFGLVTLRMAYTEALMAKHAERPRGIAAKK